MLYKLSVWLLPVVLLIGGCAGETDSSDCIAEDGEQPQFPAYPQSTLVEQQTITEEDNWAEYRFRYEVADTFENIQAHFAESAICGDVIDGVMRCIGVTETVGGYDVAIQADNDTNLTRYAVNLWWPVC